MHGDRGVEARRRALEDLSAFSPHNLVHTRRRAIDHSRGNLLGRGIPDIPARIRPRCIRYLPRRALPRQGISQACRLIFKVLRIFSLSLENPLFLCYNFYKISKKEQRRKNYV